MKGGHYAQLYTKGTDYIKRLISSTISAVFHLPNNAVIWLFPTFYSIGMSDPLIDGIRNGRKSHTLNFVATLCCWQANCDSLSITDANI